MSHETNSGETISPTSQTSQQTLNKLANGEHLKQKRARSQLSCIPCRQGKLKCNRSHDPACDQCIKRSREGQCSYVPPPKKQKSSGNVKGRIRQLENLVVDLMNQQSKDGSTNQTDGAGTAQAANLRTEPSGPLEQPTPPSDNDTSPQEHSFANGGRDDIDSTTKPFGRLQISKGEISYVGETHWQAILNGISDLKRELGDEQEDEAWEQPQSEQEHLNLAWGNAFNNVPLDDLHTEDGCASHASTGLGLMLGTGGRVTREQLIQAVPEKKVADRLLSLWFNSPDPFKPIIHAPTFQSQYRDFWRDPKDTPTMWLGLFFAIASLAASFALRDVDPKSDFAKKTLRDVNRYHTLAGSAAVLADFTKPKAHTMECLMLYGAGLRSNDAFVNVWLILGLIVRLGLRMGYHRDPSNHPGISVFDGEMRRRVWATISMIDVLISFQLGLPGMVKTIQSDTRPPSNLLDRDFKIGTTVLPPSRGIDELTPSSYTRAKLKIVNVFADVNELIHATIPPSHEQMMDLDRRLEDAQASIPPLLQMPDISELVTDPAEQLMCRCNLDLLYLKTKMVLHRRYMEQPFAQLSTREQQLGIGFSRKACVDAALRVLRHHHTIYSASQPGGQLESVKWYMGSISTHDFLLAAMIVCLELSQQISDDPTLNPSGRMCPLRSGMMDALEKSQKIWSATATKRKPTPNSFNGSSEHIGGEHMYNETEKASRAMSVMLDKVRAKFPQQAEALRNINMNRPAERPGMGVPNDDLGIDFSQPQKVAARTAGSIPFGGIVSYHNWDNAEPESLQYGLPGMDDGLTPWLARTSTAVSNSSPNVALSNGSTTNTFSQSNSNDTSPDAQYSTLPDFSMIGDMLDMPGAIDWEMFDAGVNKNPTSDIPTQNFVPGNVLMNGGTGPGAFDGSAGLVSGGETRSFPGSYLMFSDLDMEGVDFEMPAELEADLTRPPPPTWEGVGAPLDATSFRNGA